MQMRGKRRTVYDTVILRNCRSCHDRLGPDAPGPLIDKIHHRLPQLQHRLQCGCLHVDTNDVLRAARSDESTPRGNCRNKLVDFGLQPLGLHARPLRVGGLESRPVCHDHLDLSVWQVLVHDKPFRARPVQKLQACLNCEHVRNCIAHGLVDEFPEQQQLLCCFSCGAWFLRVVPRPLDEGIAEENGAMTVGLEVNADVKCQRGVVAMLHAGLRAQHVLLAQHLLGIHGGAAVGVSRLHDPNLNSLQTASLHDSGHKMREQQRLAVAIQHSEACPGTAEKVHRAVGIPIQTDALDRRRVDALRLTLLQLHKVRSTTVVQRTFTLIPKLHLKSGILEALHLGAQGYSPNAICAIHHDFGLVILWRGSRFDQCTI
mmetsp:Transcript_131705/g.421390  ORF Transcript_131705/g.421390 Transcript_131705/m.421390 type:complete len:373 (-) Transcript_131705:749-1867(-)